MTPERWRQVEILYHSALERSPSDRASFLKDACQDDELRREVESLLDQPAQGAIDIPLFDDGAPLEMGQRLGSYEILGPIGAGGMGAVYKAFDSRLNRTVAVKVSKARFNGRFKREALAIAALNHPNICTVYDIGPNYLVMEYVDGHCLKGPLPLPEALRYAVQVADALDAAHRKGIVHRDLKPANILAAKAGVKLLDFGLAKIEVQPSQETQTVLTREGEIMGSLNYMSPEQLQGKETGPRSDIFSFGAVMVEMITGRRAFEGENQASVISAIMAGDPPALKAQGIPPGLERAIRRCLAKDPEDRWQTARDLHAELKWIQESSSAPAVAIAPAARSKSTPWMVALAIAAVAAGLWILATRSGSPPPAQAIRSSILPPPGFSFIPYYFAISPDGTRLAFVAMGADGATALWVRAISGSAAQQLSGTQNAWYPFWSPDSRRIGFFADGKLKTVDLAGGAPQILADVVSPRGGSWSTDGDILYAPSVNTPLYRVPAAGGAAAPVTKLAGASQAHRWPWFLPDGQHFLYFVDWSAPGDSPGDGIYAGSLHDLERKSLLSNVNGNVVFVSGNLLYVGDRSLLAQPFNPAKLETTGPAVPIAAQELETGSNYREGFSASENGSIVFQSAADSPARMIWYDASGLEEKQIPQVGYMDPSLSPDGKMLAVSSDDAHNGKHFIRVIDLAKNVSTQLTEGGDEHNPCWTRDGKFITYQSGSNKAASIDQVPLDRSAPARTLLRGVNVKPTSWSPDGHLTYIDFAKGGPSVTVYTAATGQSEGLAAHSEPQFSPDGKWIAAQGTDVSVHPWRGAGGPIQISSAGGFQPRWSRDGKRLFYLKGDRKMMVVDFDAAKRTASAPREVFQTHIVAYRAAVFQYDVAADGRFLINSFPVGNQAPLTLLTGWTALLKH